MNASDKLLLRDLLVHIATHGFHGDPYQHITANQEKARLGISIIDQNSGRFEFVFEGTEAQFRFFQDAVKQKVPNSRMSLDNWVDNEFHCSTIDDNAIAFKVGMIASACYSHFGHLDNTRFKQSL